MCICSDNLQREVQLLSSLCEQQEQGYRGHHALNCPCGPNPQQNRTPLSERWLFSLSKDYPCSYRLCILASYVKKYSASLRQFFLELSQPQLPQPLHHHEWGLLSSLVLLQSFLFFKNENSNNALAKSCAAKLNDAENCFVITTLWGKSNSCLEVRSTDNWDSILYQPPPPQP